MNSEIWPEQMQAGCWHWQRASGELHGPDGVQRLEPKVMDLLCLLAHEPNRVWSREQLSAALWPGVIVGDDSLARTVSKLRQALNDDAKAPRWIETIAKRGYRWIGPIPCEPHKVEEDADLDRSNKPVPLIDARLDPNAATESNQPESPDRGQRTTVSTATASKPDAKRSILMFAALVLVSVLVVVMIRRQHADVRSSDSVTAPTDASRLLARADDYYFQFSRADNEAALELYQRVLGTDPENANALAGLANALTQRAIRWPTPPGPKAREFTRLSDARQSGHMDQEPARSQLRRARQLAESAVAHAPESAAAYKALGLVASAQGELDEGLRAHQRAVALDPNAWPAMINIADVLEQLGRGKEALPWFERAYLTMDRDYARNPAQVRHWQEALGVLIAARYRALADWPAAESWYRRVLVIAPLHLDATRGLAAVLAAGGDQQAAARLCAELTERIGPDADCYPEP